MSLNTFNHIRQIRRQNNTLQTSNEFIKKLQNSDYELDEKNKNVILSDTGVDKIEKLALQKNVLKDETFMIQQI